MSAEAAQGVVMGGYARGLLCECGARRSDKAGARRATRAASRPRPRPGGKSPDGVLARVRGDAAVVREIISLRGLRGSPPHPPRQAPRSIWHGYWITSLASSRIVDGTVKPSALAVLAFKAIWKLTGARTGGLVGFSPLRMRSTKDAERRVMSALLVP
jgi:hypothetical protein